MEHTTIDSKKSDTISTEIDYNKIEKAVKETLDSSPSEKGIDIDALTKGLSPILNNPEGYANSFRDYEDAISRQRELEDPSVNTIIGRNYNYDYAEARTLAGDDLSELQAERQSQWAKRGAGIGRMIGEFGVNLLEIPGVVGGAIAAGLTFDINKMTDNFWVNYTNGLKEDLQEFLPVYQRRAIKEGDVFDKMLSADWWATDGASGIAFMGAALIPGLGLAKLPKALSITRALGAGGKWAGKVLGMLDDVAAKTGMAEKALLYAGKGKAAKQGIDLFNMTLANTIYESGIEARGAQLGYKEALVNKLESGEISQDKFEELLKNSNEVAANVFGANVALLMGPNMIMSKMLLGPRATSLSKAARQTSRMKATGRYAKREAAVAKDYAGFGAKVINPILKAGNSSTGGFIKKGVTTFAKNTTREGFFEEGGQGAIEQYFTKGRLEEELTGERTKNIAQTYLDFLNTSDGQAAVLLGGILGSSVNVFSMKAEDKEFKKNIDNYITKMNSGIDMRDVFTGNMYKTDPVDASKYILDADGNPIPDLEKAARLSQSVELVEKVNKKIELLKEEGDYIAAEALSTQLQANFMYKFIEAGEPGLEALKEVILGNPATELVVEEYNKEFGTKLSVEEYADEEVQKAIALKNDYFIHTREVEQSLSKRDIKKYNISSKDIEEVEGWKDRFSNDERVNYTTQQHTRRFFEKSIEESDIKIKKATKDGNKKALRKAKQNKARAEKNLKKVIDNITEITDDKKISKRWDAYYNEKITVKKINSQEVTDYLDSVIVDIKKATTEEEVEEIVANAKKEGLILKGVKEDRLPKKLVEMASSDNVLEALGALLTLNASDTDTHAKLRIEASRNLDRLYKGVSNIYNSIREAMLNISEKEEGNSEKLIELSERLDTVIIDIRALSEQIIFEESLDRRKVSEKAKKNYRMAVKARNEAVKLMTDINKEIEDVNKQRITAHKKLSSYKHALRMVADVTTNKEIKEAMNSLLSSYDSKTGKLFKFNEDNVFIAGKPLTTMPFTMGQVLDALYSQKELMVDMSNDIGNIVIHSSELEYLNNLHTYYKGMKNELEGILGLLKSTISRNSKLKSSPENDDLLIKSNEEAAKIEKKLVELDAKVYDIEDKLSNDLLSQLNAFDSYMSKLTEIIEAVENLDFSKIQTDPDLPTSDQQENESEEDRIKVTPDQNFDKSYEIQEDEKKGFFKVIKAIKQALGVEIKVKSKEVTKESKEFLVIKDTTDGEGFNRIEEKDKEIFNTLFSSNEESLLNKLQILVEAYKKNSTGETLRDIYMVLKVHPYLASKIPNSIHEELVYASEEALNLFQKFSNYKSEVIKENKKDTKLPTKKNNTISWMSLINNTTNIDEEISAVISEKKASLRRNKLEILKETASAAGMKWELALAVNDAITEGSEVYTEKGEKGKVVLLLKTKESGTNVLIEGKNGITMVSIENVYRKDRNTEILNKTVEEQFIEFSENKRRRSEGGKFTSTSISLVGRDKPSTRRNPKTGAIEGVDKAFLSYMHETRDKSNDIIVPSFSISYLKKQVKEAAKDPKREVEYLNARKALELWEKLILDIKLPIDELEHLANYLPITLRVNRAGEKGSAGTYLNIKTEANSKTSFKSMEGSVRRAIMGAWVSNGMKFSNEGAHPHTLTGVTLKWAHIGQGQLNVDPSAPKKGFNKITNLKGVTIDNMKIYAVQEDNADMKAYDKKGEVVSVPWTTTNKKGMVILELTTNTGAIFPLILEQKKLKGTEELNIIMSIVEDILLNEEINFTSDISEEIKESLKEKIPLLFDSFSGNITYEDLYRTILYPGKMNTQTQVILSPSKRTITIGGIEYSSDEFNTYKGTIKNILGFKYHRTGFSNPANNVNMLTVENTKYLNYLIESKILRTNVVENEDIFVSIPVEGSREHKGMGAFLTAASVRSDKNKPITITSSKNTGKAKINIMVRQKLHVKGIEVKTLSDAKIKQLNELFAKTKFKDTGKTEFEEIVKQINEEAGNNEIKPC